MDHDGPFGRHYDQFILLKIKITIVAPTIRFTLLLGQINVRPGSG